MTARRRPATRTELVALLAREDLAPEFVGTVLERLAELGQALDVRITVDEDTTKPEPPEWSR